MNSKIKNVIIVLMLGSSTVSIHAMKLADKAVSTAPFINMEPDCPICFEDFKNTDTITRLTCPCTTTAFHEACLRQCYAAKAECPVCRGKVTTYLRPVTYGQVLEAKKPKSASPIASTPSVRPPQSQSSNECSACNKKIEPRDYITTKHCDCPQSFHYACRMQQLEDSQNHCPTCRAPVNSLQSVEFKPQTSFVRAEVPNINPQRPTSAPWLATSPDIRLREPIVNPAPAARPTESQWYRPQANPQPRAQAQPRVNLQEIDGVTEILIALLSGIGFENIYRSDSNRQEKLVNAGLLGTLCLGLIYGLNKEQQRPLSVRLGLWSAGLTTGVVASYLFNKFRSR